jgi:ferredoxin--NADP+ reductase
MAKPLSYNGVLVKREDYTAELTVFHLRYDEPLPEKDGRSIFLPGQYIAIGLNNESEPDKGSVRRSMSIASAPEEGQTLQFYVRWVKHPASDNPLTHLLWKMKQGDRIFMTRKPVGKFTLEDTMPDDPRLKILVAAGTGLAPFVSIARSRVLRDPKAELSDLVLLHGASYPADLVFREELEGLRESNGLHYFPTVSRPDGTDWNGDKGRVEDFFKSERLAVLESAIGLLPGELTPKKAGILICGLQGTIAQTILRMNHRGFVPFDRKLRAAFEVPDGTPPSIWWEQYDTDPVVDTSDDELMAKVRAELRAALRADQAEG